jgi:hypothetical protein
MSIALADEEGVMATNEYHFITNWRVKTRQNEVVAIISDAESLPRWWPSVYLEVRVFAPGDANGIGKRVDLFTKGWLPYTLRWQFTVTEVVPDGFTLVAEGDFVGRGIWTFGQDGDWVDIIYDWKIEANKPLLKYLSFALKPLFAMNHEWAMAQGERSLELELRRRAGESGVPEPPPPTPTAFFPWLAYILTHPRTPRQMSK